MKENNQQILNITAELVQKDFELDLPEDVKASEESLRDVLADYIFVLMQNNLERLFTILYLMDVNEGKVHAILDPNNDNIANVELANLVIERQKAKAIIRMQYLQEDEEDEDVERW